MSVLSFVTQDDPGVVALVTALPGPDRKRTVSPYSYRLTYRNPDPQAAGCVMVTREGDPDDYLLGPGDELLLVGRGLVAAWALSPARLVVSRGAAMVIQVARRDEALATA